MKTETTSKVGHTPGPWETTGAKYVWKRGETGGAIAMIAEPECATSSDFEVVEISSRRWDEAMANARLIAAAPEMLAALEKFIEAEKRLGYGDTLREKEQDQGGNLDNDDASYLIALESAFAAINKATGNI